MNEHTAFPPRAIELAAEPPFQLGSLLVTPAALELRAAGHVVTLEPRVMQVLVALQRTQGAVVSRDELLDLCWDARVVGDDSLNRCVSQLRKAFAGYPAVSVETIPRVGYRLRLVDEPPADADQEPVAAAEPERPSQRGRLFVLGLAGLAGAAAVAVAFWPQDLWPNRAKPWTVASIRPLTRDGSIETHPALSPDGLSIAYAGGPAPRSNRDILLRSVDLGSSTPTRLTDTPESDESAPAWSPSGDRLAFLRRGADGSCHIVMMPMPNGAERIVGRCQDAYAGLAWLSGEELLYGDRAEGTRARRLMALNVVSGETRAVTNPPPASLGDTGPVVSSDARRIAFRRTAAMGSDDVYLLETDTGRIRPLTRGGWKALGFAWAGDGETLFFSSNRKGDFGLWAISSKADAEPYRVAPGVLPMGRLSTDRTGRRIAMETGRLRAGLTRIGPDGAGLQPLSAADALDWDPDVGPDGSVIFASERDGSNQIWLRRPDGGLHRLTSLGASYLHSPRWSDDGRQIAFLAVVDGATDVYVMNADGSRLTRVTTDGQPKGRVAWTGLPGQILFTHLHDDLWQVSRRQLATGRQERLPGTDGVSVIERTGKRLFARKVFDDRIHLLDPVSGRLADFAAPIRTESPENWAPRADGIVHLRRNGETDELWLTTWNGDARRMTGLQLPARANFAVAADGSIIVPHVASHDFDLMLMELG
ncbi:MAG: hypothetical protein DI568_00110 [Sphingomonas sp.]|nr:MAG: hypothetical protein DI568_00110 [Sphingomonas sp.]